LLGTLLTSCSWWKGSDEETTKVVASQSIEKVWSTDVDGRKPADPLAYGNAATTMIAGEQRIVIGGGDARAHIYNLNGSELFRTALLESSDSGAVALQSGLVVLSDTGANLYAINAVSGDIAWRFSLSSPVTGTPVVVENDVLIQTSDNRIYRIDAKGKKVWSFAGQPGGLGLYLNASPLLHDGKVYVLLTNGDALALDAANGDLIWRKQLLLNADASHLSDIKAPQATPVWVSELSLDGNTARNLVLFPFYQGDLFALNSDDGTTLLTHHISIKTSPIVDKEYIYMADSSGTLQAIERATGDVLWSITLSNDELVGPVIWDNSFWLGDDKGHIFRVNHSGKLQASLSISGAIDRKPIVTRSGVLFHSSLGGLYLVH
jgi:outer membrane protein assembly factor BamB